MSHDDIVDIVTLSHCRRTAPGRGSVGIWLRVVEVMPDAFSEAGFRAAKMAGDGRQRSEALCEGLMSNPGAYLGQLPVAGWLSAVRLSRVVRYRVREFHRIDSSLSHW